MSDGIEAPVSRDGGATVAPAWRMLAFVVGWPVVETWAWEAWDPITRLEAHLTATGRAPANEAPVIASQLLFLPEAALWLVPGLVAFALWGPRRNGAPTARTTPMWAWTVVIGLGTLLVGMVMHALVDLPTGDLGAPEAVASVRVETRLVDVLLYSLFPALFEEYYYRGRLFRAMSSWMTTRATIGWTALAFAVCHRPELMPFALVWGVGAGFARARLGSFWPIVAGHAVWNAIAYADAWQLLG